MDVVEEHRQHFNAKVLEAQETKGKNSRMLTLEHYVNTVERLKILENPSERRTLTDSNLMRRFALLREESEENVVEKLVKPGTYQSFVPFEELFEMIHDVHVNLGHPGRDVMQKYMASRFANVTIDHFNIYKNLCIQCGLKKLRSKKTNVVNQTKSSGELSFRNLNSNLEESFSYAQYSDVTLVSDELTPFHAHKIVLSSCSDVFKNLFIENADSQPLIYLRDVRGQDLQSIMQFIYLGQTKISKMQSKKFFEAARKLGIKRLIDADQESTAFLGNDAKKATEKVNPNLNVAKFMNKYIKDDELSHCKRCYYIDENELSLKKQMQVQHESRMYSCTSCEHNITDQDHLPHHKQSTHGDANGSCCHKCGHQATELKNLRKHQTVTIKSTQHQRHINKANF